MTTWRQTAPTVETQWPLPPAASTAGEQRCEPAWERRPRDLCSDLHLLLPPRTPGVLPAWVVMEEAVLQVPTPALLVVSFGSAVPSLTHTAGPVAALDDSTPR